MKDKNNTKFIIVVVVLIVALLLCLLGIRSCERSEGKTEDDQIVEPDDEQGKENDVVDDVVEEVVPQAETTKVTTPTIRLVGEDTVYVEINTEYVDAGAIAEDEKYGDLTKEIVIDNPVDTSKLGTYIITYSITNKDGKTAQVERTVIVEDTLAPVLTYKDDYEGEGIVPIDANRSGIFTNHYVIASDNSNEVSLQMSYFYKAQIEDEYEEVDEMDISKLGYYLVYYTAVDPSGNSVEEPLIIEYMVQDVLPPVINVSQNGTAYPVVDVKVLIEAIDDYTELKSLAYAWIQDKDAEEVEWNTIESGTTVTLEENGAFYLLIKAQDMFDNESVFTSEVFEKDDTLMNTTNFNLYRGSDYQGVSAGIQIHKLESMEDVQSVVVKLYSGDTLLATNTNTSKIYELSLNDGSIELSTPFIITPGTYTEEYWVTEVATAYAYELRPTRVVFEVLKSNGEKHVLENNTLAEPDGTFWEGFFFDYDLLVSPTRGHYTTIQAAITNANEGDTILVLPGRYDETLTVDKTVQIYGLDKEQTIVTTTSAPSRRAVENYYGANPVIYVENGALTLSDVTVRSDLATVSEIDGITVNNGNLTLDQVIVTNIRNNDRYSGAQHGRGVTAYGTSTIVIKSSHFNNFNKNGCHFIGAGVNATITDTTFIGAGTDPEAAAQNGIVFMNGASGVVQGNIFTNFQYHDPDTSFSYGILEYENEGGSVQNKEDNIFNNCDVNY